MLHPFHRLGIVIVTAAALAACGPKYRAPLDIKVSVDDSTLVERGRYLVEHVGHCALCHTTRTFTNWEAVWEDKGPPHAGGMVIDDSLFDGFPGRIVTPNLTPDRATGLGDWTDGEIARAIREGVNRKNEALFPMMAMYKGISENDTRAIVAYLRSLPPSPMPTDLRTDLDFPVGLFIAGVPKPLEGEVADPAVDDPVKQGDYLIGIAGCRDCHTPNEGMEPIEGMDFAGGNVDAIGGSEIVFPNITPDKETGIGNYTKEDFIRLIREGIKRNGVPMVGPMAWRYYKGMTDKDLDAIWAFLQTVKPIRNDVTLPENQHRMK